GIASTMRSIPAAKPMPVRSGPPRSLTRPSYRPPPSRVFCAPRARLRAAEVRPRVGAGACHERVVDAVADAQEVELAPHLREVLAARRAQVLEDPGKAGDDVLVLRRLRVEDPHAGRLGP